MLKLKTYIQPIFFFIIIFAGVLIFTTNGCAASAKQEYIAADVCYRNLRQQPSKKQKAADWLRCINKYKSIYTVHPDDSWAPAGMYKAARLYLTLSKLSGKKRYENQAVDLLLRLKNRYTRSAYAQRSKSLLLSINTQQTQKPKHIKSQKKLTRNDALIKKFIHNQDDAAYQTQDDMQPAPAKGSPAGDATITDLRFWSNPEYTRVVIDADAERDYFHRLLKKDPEINKPFQRLYIDIDQSTLGKNIAEHTPINDDLLKQARAGQHLPHTVRVVVDIKSFENYKIFSLKDPFRIVIDVWGTTSEEMASDPGRSTADSGSGKKPEKLAQVTTDNLQSSDIARQLALGVRTIVIDPGHGGSDPGAPGYFKNIWEKDIVLKMAKKLARILRNRLKCTVILTRSKDEKLSLEERTAIANTKKADLFISLHLNAARNRNLHGIETYILNLATDEKAIAVAARENATSEKNISDLEYILSDLMKHAKVEESSRLANVVHNSFIKGLEKEYSNVNDLGVKQAPFYVLLGARMPSILIEASFISNKAECRRLMKDSYQTSVSHAITDGVEKYIETTNPKQL